MQPKYCVLLDVGTKPRSSSLYAFWKHFEADSNVAGVCGQITTRDHGISLCIPVVGSQHFEYKIASVLDKSFESTMGFLAVLPGAFSAYRWTALRGDPLAAYFSQLFVKDVDLNPLVANMMLAEDRILCFQLVAKEGCNHVLHYLNAAVAETDVPYDLPKLLKQRRRWLNGSFFALLYALGEYGTFYSQTTHSSWRKMTITFEFFYFLVSLLTQWLALGLFPLINIFVFRALQFHQATLISFLSAYCVFVMIQFALALKNDPVRFSKWYNLSAAFIGIVFLFLNITILEISMRSIASGDPYILITIFLSFGAYIVSALLHGELVTLATSSITYLFMMPTFLIILPIFAFCNVHDISWGTKDLNTAAFGNADADADVRRQVRRRFQWFRARLLLVWLGSNVALTAVSMYYDADKIFLFVVLAVLVFMNGSRFVGSILYLSGAHSNSARLVKIVIAPIRPRTYMALVKLPLFLLLAALGLVTGLLSYLTAGLATPALRPLARSELSLAHYGTSEAKYKFADRRSSADIRRYFLRYRVPATVITAVLVPLVVGAIVEINTGRLCTIANLNICVGTAWLRWAATLVLIFALLNIVYAHDYVVRRLSQRFLT